MKLLLLGPECARLVDYLSHLQVSVSQTEEVLYSQTLQQQGFDFLICYGYRHILKKDILALFPDKAINLHISFLPWNRGADPNLWSFVDNTPKGVSIHHIDEGVDTGDIIAQRQIEFSERETLASSYQTLQYEIQALFMEFWPRIADGSAPRRAQTSNGSFHEKKDRRDVEHLLVNGWNTVVKDLSLSR